MFAHKIKLSVIVCTALLTGCATNVNIREYFPAVITSSPVDYESLYLRGIFNWWEAEPAYKVVPNPDGYSVNVKLIADGQPYDFRFADINYTSELNCGAEAPDNPIKQDQEQELVCVSGSHNLQFVPNETGTYRFTLLPNGSPSLRITRIQ